MSRRPILYSFRRCPYAMRARMALWVSAMVCELREVKLANKPAALLAVSAKGTVPVLVLPEGPFAEQRVIDESLDIMRYALAAHDPEDWLSGDDPALIALIDGPFKHHLDRYKYPSRYANSDPEPHRAAGYAILQELDSRLAKERNLCGEARTLADIASFPFIRQFANTDRAWLDAQPIPHLQAWLARHLGSDLFANVMTKYTPWQPGDPPVLFGCAEMG